MTPPGVGLAVRLAIIGVPINPGPAAVVEAAATAGSRNLVDTNCVVAESQCAQVENTATLSASPQYAFDHRQPGNGDRTRGNPEDAEVSAGATITLHRQHVGARALDRHVRTDVRQHR